jgi:hypothetical protein
MRNPLLILISAAAMATLLPAQDSTARLLGTVTDQSGATIPGATVTARNTSTSVERKTVSNGTGDYSIPLLPVGEYTITTEANGFKTSTLGGIILQVGQEARFDVKLAIGTASESVVVTAQAPLLVTDASSVGQVIDSATLANVPLNGRQFWQLAQLTPGAVFTPGGQDITSGGQGIRASRVQLRMSGSSRLAGGWVLDGFDITEYEQGGTSITPSTDALEEFKVLAGGMSAEYRLPSVVNAVLKSGSNSFDGSVYEYVRNDKFQERNFFSPTVPELRRNEFGATLGGPIKRNKIFFFADYEGDRTVQGTTQNSTVPSPAEVMGNFAGQRPIFDPLTTQVNPSNPNQFIRTQFPNNVIPASRIAPQAAYFDSWFPTPNSGKNQFIYSPALTLNTDKFDVKVSPRLTEKDSIVSRYSFINNNETDVQGYPILGDYPLHSRAQNAGISYIHIISPNMTAEAAFNYYRMLFFFQNASNYIGKDVIEQAGISGYQGLADLQPAAPQINPSGYTAIMGATDNRPKANRIRTWEYRTALTWSHGSHNIKFGAELAHQNHAFLNGNTSQGQLNFNGQYTQNPISTGNTGDAFADFLLGYPNSMQRSTPAQLFGVYGNFWTVYGQDDWHVSRDLTINVGLRWEFNSWFSPINGLTNAFDFSTGKVIIPTMNGTPNFNAQPNEATNWQVFQPLLETTQQLGLPYSIRPADNLNPAPRIGLAWRLFGSDKWVVRSAYGIFYIYPDTNQLQPLYRAPPFNVIQLTNNDQPTAAQPVPVRTLGNFFLGQPLASLTADPAITTTRTKFRDAYTQTWNLNLQHDFGHNLVAEVGYVANKGTRLEYSSNGNIPLPGPGNIQARRPYPSWGQFVFQEWGGSSTYESLQSKLEKRFAHGFTALVSYTFSKCLDSPGTEEGASPAWYLDPIDKGACTYDVPQNFVSSYVWELPFGSGRKYFSNVPRLVNGFIGGWQWQGINTIQSGVPFTPTISSDVANTGASSERPNSIAAPVMIKSPNCWFFVSANPACLAADPNQANTFTVPAQYTYGNAGRNILRSGKLVQFDMSLFKKFRITEKWNLDFRAQVYNLANTPSFSAPSTNVNLSTGGLVTSTRNLPRVYEFGMKLNF